MTTPLKPKADFTETPKLGTYILSFGFDLLGPTDNLSKQNGTVKLGDIFTFETDRKQQPSGGKKIILKKMPHEFKLKQKTGEEATYSLVFETGRLLGDCAPSYPKEEIDKRIWEYFVKESDINKDVFDEFLIRLFSRKSSILTEKEWEGFTHVKLLDFELELTALKPTNDVETSLIKHVQLEMVENKVLVDKEIPSRVNLDEKYKVRVRSYLFFDLSRTRETEAAPSLLIDDSFRSTMKVYRSAVMVTVIEPSNEIEKKKLITFLGSSNNLYVDLAILEQLSASDEMKNMLELWHEEQILENKSFFESRVKNSPYCLTVEDSAKKSHQVLPLYNLLIALLWSKVVQKVRCLLSNSYGKQKSRYTDSKWFEENLVENKRVLSLEYKIVNMEMPVDMKTFSNLELKANDAYSEFIINLIWGSHSSSRDELLINTFNKQGRIYVLPLGGIFVFYFNTVLVISGTDLFKEEKFFKSKLDFVESGHRWNTTWCMMISSMLCYIAEIFMLYDEKLSKHIEEKREAHELAALTRQAFNDFAEYYVQGTISEQRIYQKRFFEVAKESMGLNEMYNTLVARLNLFSSHQIGEESAKFARTAEILTILLTVIGVTTFLVDLFSAYKYIIAAAGIMGVIVTFAWRQHRNKRKS